MDSVPDAPPPTARRRMAEDGITPDRGERTGDWVDFKEMGIGRLPVNRIQASVADSDTSSINVG